MADGMLCINCGHQETPHNIIDEKEDWGEWIDQEEANSIKSGRSFSLINCPGFEPEDLEEAERLREKWEKENANARPTFPLGPDDYDD